MATNTGAPILQLPPAERNWLKIVLVQVAALLVLAFIWLSWQLLIPISHRVVLFLLGAVVAFVLADPADLLARRLGGRRMVGIMLAYLIVFVVVIGGMLLLAVPFVQQATSLVGDLPKYSAQVQGRVNDLDTALQAHGIQLNLSSIGAQAVKAVESNLGAMLGTLIRDAAALGGALMDALLVLVISVYPLTGAVVIQHNALQVVPERYRGVHEFVRSSAARVMGGYLRGQLIMAAVIGTLAGAGTGLLGLPYFVVLGVLAGLFELVPMFGPILSAVPAVIVALFMPWPTVVWVILLFLIVQQFESNVLGPKVTAHAVGLHPLGAMFALLVGFEVAGILGGLFAVPVAGVTWVLVSAVYRHLLNAAPVIELVGEVPVSEGVEEPLLMTGSTPSGPSESRP